MTETLLVSLIVTGAAGYVVWTLLPQPARRKLARWAGRPEPAGRCAGCGGGTGCTRPDAGERTVTVLRRR